MAFTVSRGALLTGGAAALEAAVVGGGVADVAPPAAGVVAAAAVGVVATFGAAVGCCALGALGEGPLLGGVVAVGLVPLLAGAHAIPHMIAVTAITARRRIPDIAYPV